MNDTISNKNDLAVSVKGLTKKYRIARNVNKQTTLAEAMLHRLRNPIQRAKTDEFEALSDINFDVQKGEVVGIIGRNGAGKSTLLKVLSQITEPTQGEIALYGRVGSLLEVGTGFHPELTGRENIFLNGSILGMTKKEIAKQLDAIVEFSGVEKFLETPVKRYSSGMYIRLAFAVAAHLRTEILVVDEVLAVGDAEFQSKCLGKMQDVAQTGRTVLFVSHSMQSISKLCSSALLLHAGKVNYRGDVTEAVERYLNSALNTDNEENKQRRLGRGQYRFDFCEPSKSIYRPEEEKRFTFQITRHGEALPRLILWADIIDERDVIIAHLDSRLSGVSPRGEDKINGEFSFSVPWLKPGKYRVDLSIRANGMIDKLDFACIFHVSTVLPYDFPVEKYEIHKTLVLSDANWQTEQTPEID